jgi:hypothetical protein
MRVFCLVYACLRKPIITKSSRHYYFSGRGLSRIRKMSEYER